MQLYKLATYWQSAKNSDFLFSVRKYPVRKSQNVSHLIKDPQGLSCFKLICVTQNIDKYKKSVVIYILFEQDKIKSSEVFNKMEPITV